MQRQFKITVNGTDYDVAVEELSSPAAQFMPSYSSAPVISAPPATSAAAPVANKAAGAGDQCAQMGGVVASILVKEGQMVNEKEKILELEAMKMKVPLMASCAGKVSKISVAIGDAVTSGQVLVTIS